MGSWSDPLFDTSWPYLQFMPAEGWWWMKTRCMGFILRSTYQGVCFNIFRIVLAETDSRSSPTSRSMLHSVDQQDGGNLCGCHYSWQHLSAPQVLQVSLQTQQAKKIRRSVIVCCRLVGAQDALGKILPVACAKKFAIPASSGPAAQPGTQVVTFGTP